MRGLAFLLELAAAIGAMEDMDEIRRSVLQAIRGVIWFDTAIFWLYPPARNWAEHIVVDTPADSMLDYLRHYAEGDEFHQAYSVGNFMAARSTDLLASNDWIRNSAYFRDFFRCHEVYCLLAFDIKDSNGIYGAICLRRGKGREFSEGERSLLSWLYPHLVNRLRWFSEKEALLMQLQEKHRAVNACACWSDSLTVREKEIVQQVLAGASNLETAKNLGISINTVKMHLQNIYAKLEIKRRNQLFHQ